MIVRCLPPSAILTPISLVRSSTTTFMMLETPMPPTTRVSAPIDAEEEAEAEHEGRA